MGNTQHRNTSSSAWAVASGTRPDRITRRAGARPTNGWDSCCTLPQPARARPVVTVPWQGPLGMCWFGPRLSAEKGVAVHGRRRKGLRRALQRSTRRVRTLLATTNSGLVTLAALIGLLTGLLGVALALLVEAVSAVTFGATPRPALVLIAPPLGALLAGLVLWRIAPDARGGGISQVMEALALRSGTLRARVIPAKLLAAGVALGTGSSGGREGPIVHIGAATGSVLGRLAALPEDRVRSLIAAGAAGGIAASFNAPIGGMLFALEVIIGGFALRHLQTVIVAAVIASVTARQLIGEPFAFTLPPHAFEHSWELLLYALLGLAAVIVGIAFIAAVRAASQFAERLGWPLPLRMAAGGLVVGLIAVVAPEVLGSGSGLPPLPGVAADPIEVMVVGGYGIGVLALLLVAKLLASAVTAGSGSAVGTFGPLLFLGAALGAAFGQAADAVLPTGAVTPGSYAIAGTAAVVAAASRAPLTGIVLIFELTGSYDLVLPLMVTTGVATVVANRLMPSSLYTEPLARKGITYAPSEDVDVLQTVTVGEVMHTAPDTVDVDLPAEALADWFARTHHHGAAVVRHVDGAVHLVGMVTLGDLRSRTGATAGELATTDPVTVSPDDPAYLAVQRMAMLDIGRLPVVDPADRRRLVGLLPRSAVLAAYQQALTRSLADHERATAQRLRNLSGADVVEVTLPPEAVVAGRRVAEVTWPQGTVLTGVQRAGQLIVPSGATVLQAGDVVFALTQHDVADQLRAVLSEVRT